MKPRLSLLLILLLCSRFQIYSESIKTFTVTKKHENHIFTFYPVKVTGTMENMRYYYIYKVKFRLNTNSFIKIRKIAVFLPEKSTKAFVVNKTLYLHKGKFIFNLPVKKKKNLEFESFKIRFYFSNPRKKEEKTENKPSQNANKKQKQNKRTDNAGDNKKVNNNGVSTVNKSSNENPVDPENKNKNVQQENKTKADYIEYVINKNDFVKNK